MNYKAALWKFGQVFDEFVLFTGLVIVDLAENPGQWPGGHFIGGVYDGGNRNGRVGNPQS